MKDFEVAGDSWVNGGTNPEPSVLAVALSLHASRWGSSDPLHPDEERRLLDALRHRLDNWKPTSHAAWLPFDEAVRALLRAAVNEYGSEVPPAEALGEAVAREQHAAVQVLLDMATIAIAAGHYYATPKVCEAWEELLATGLYTQLGAQADRRPSRDFAVELTELTERVAALEAAKDALPLPLVDLIDRRVASEVKRVLELDTPAMRGGPIPVSLDLEGAIVAEGVTLRLPFKDRTVEFVDGGTPMAYRDFVKRYVADEFVTIEFDLGAGTARVVPIGGK